MGEALARWELTPYMRGQRCRGVAVDCVRFVTGLLDDLYGFERAEAPRLPPDIAFHNRRGALAGMREVLRLYRPYDRVRDGTIEPGDVIVSGPVGGGPGHGMIVGVERATIYHAVENLGVIKTGLGLVANSQGFFAIFRVGDKERWAR